MANLGNTIINGALRVNGKINSSDVISAPSFVGALTGNADTATKLKTARTINGVNFDGSANITVADSTKLPLTGGTLSGDLNFSHAGSGNPASIGWNTGTIRQRIRILDEGTTDNNVFEFQQSRDSGGTYATLMAITSDNKVKAATFVGALSGNANSATNATNTAITNTNPTTGTWYYPTWVTGTSGNLPERTNDGLRYYSLQGTTSALGHSYVQIGNATAAGTAGNKQGHLRIYSGSSGYVDLDVSSTTSNFVITLPAASGTVSLNGHTHSYLPLSGGNLTGRTTVQSAGQETPAHTNTQLLIDTTLNTPNPSLGFREQGTSDGVLYMHQRALYWSSGKAIAGEVPAANTGYKILHTGNFTNTIGDVLLKSGGTMNETAQIQRKGGTSSSWYNGRDNALIKYNSYTGYNPLLSMKTTAGSWELGAYSDNKLHLSYITDANYTAKTNAQTRDFVFNVASNTITASIDGNAATATKLQTARTIGVSGVTGTAQSFNGTANIVIPITAVPSTLLTNKSAIKGSEITNDKHWVPSSDASVTNFVSMTAEEYATNASGLATGTIVAITDGVEGYVTTQATSLTCDLPLDL